MKKRSVYSQKRIVVCSAVLLLAVMIGGGLLTWYVLDRTDRAMKDTFLEQTRLIADSLNTERIKTFSGSEKDLANEAYKRLKKQFQVIKENNPSYRFLYLLGRSSDGELFTAIDNEPIDSPDYSPPGEPYAEAHEAERNVFGTGRAATFGPFKNRWGTWVSALVPLFAPEHALYEASTISEAQEFVYEAQEFYRRHGRERFLHEVAKRDGSFHDGDLYVFAYDRDMTFLAHPVKPELVGKNLIDEKDWTGGTYFRQEIRRVALQEGNGWVDYEYENPVTGVIEPKTTFVLRVDDLIVCAGAYKGRGPVMAAFGIDIDARLWKTRLVHAARLPLIFTFVLVAVIVALSAFLLWRSAKGYEPFLLRYLEVFCILFLGFAITVFVAWAADQNERFAREKIFTHIAIKNIDMITSRLQRLRDNEIESLALFFENSGEVTPDEFHNFTHFLAENKAVRLWTWCPAVSAAERDSFVSDIRAHMASRFDIWKREDNTPIVATGNDMYYPVLYVAPPTEKNTNARGYDLASEASRRAAIDEAIQTGFTTATAPVRFADEEGEEKSIRICRAVFDDAVPERVRGIVWAVLRLNVLMPKMVAGNTTVFTGIYFLSDTHGSELLAADWRSDFTPYGGLTFAQPIPIFGRVFRLNVHAGEDFLRLYPSRAGLFIFLIGSTLTAIVAFLTVFFIRQRTRLHELVNERTGELERAFKDVEIARKAVDTERKKYATLFYANSDALLLLDRQQIIDCNPAAVALFGCTSKEELCRLHLVDISALTQEDGTYAKEASDHKLMCAMHEGDLRYSWIHKRIDTHVSFPAEVILTKISIDCTAVLQASIRDMSERVNAEKEREKAYERIRRNEMIALSMMEDANAARKEAEQLKRQADAAYVAKSQFLANMSHEIRTPMNAILGYGKMLNKTALDEKQTDYLSMVLSGGEMLLELIDDILDVSKFEAGKLELETVDFKLDGLCRDALNMIRPRVQDLPIRTAVHIADDVPLELNGDPTKLRQLLVNLLGNAAKFTDRGEISLSVFNAGSSGDSGDVDLRIHVKDTGIGIPADKQKAIFQPFTQADESTTRKFGGTGLGLTICKAIVEAMGGNIWVESDEGAGSEFFLTIRLKRALGIKTGTAVSAPEPTYADNICRGSTVLVAEDNSINQMLMKEYLRILEVESDFVANGAEAIEKIKTGGYDMCLMDVQMPVLNGLEATMIIRSEVSKDFPIIGLSAAVMEEDKEKGYAAGMNDYLSKPIDIEELKKIIAKWKSK